MSAQSVLVVDDEPDIRALLQDILEDEGYSVSTAENASAAQESIDESRPDLVLLDIWMPGTDGVSLLKGWQRSGALSFPVIMISGHGTVETAVEATRHGAVDFIEKPVSMAKLLLTVEKALAQSSAERSGGQSSAPRLPWLVGGSEHTRRLRAALDKHLKQRQPLIISGPIGSGRTSAAQWLHDNDPAASGPFIHLRCDTLSPGQGLKELFGEERDDGVVRGGYLEAAGSGTLLLSDVDELPDNVQQALAESIERGSYSRVGGRIRIPLRCRLVASRNAESAGRRRQLDSSLASRFGAEPLELLALSEHPEDIPALLEAHVNWHVEQEGLPYRHFTVAAQNWLRNQPWPGNLLELKNLVQRVLLLGGGAEIDADELEQALGSQNESGAQIPLRHDLPLREARTHFERAYLVRCLQDAGGNIGELARHVGMERTHLYRKLRNLNIDLDKIRE